MIDLHCHLLPGVDDGPPTMDDALALCRAQVAAGVTRAAATPHVSWEVPTSASRAADGRRALQAALDAQGVALEVLAGGEIAISRGAELADDELHALALGGGSWLLMEAPLSPAAVGFDRVLHALQARGHRVLIAHPERCPAFHRDLDALEALVHAGMLCQVTAQSFAGRYGEPARRTAAAMAARGLVHVVASDAHDARRRPPGLREDLEAAGFAAEHVAWWTEAVPAAIVDGSRIPPGPPPPRAPRLARRSLFGRRR